MKILNLVIAISIWLAVQPPAHSAPSFKDAVAAYNAGKYAQALQDFSAFKASSPNNVLTRYYLALCHQALNHTSQAKEEYNFVLSYGDPTLKGYASKGLAQMSGLRSQSSSQASSAVIKSGGGSVGQQAPAPTKVRKVIEFYTDW